MFAFSSLQGAVGLVYGTKKGLAQVLPWACALVCSDVGEGAQGTTGCWERTPAPGGGGARPDNHLTKPPIRVLQSTAGGTKTRLGEWVRGTKDRRPWVSGWPSHGFLRTEYDSALNKRSKETAPQRSETRLEAGKWGHSTQKFRRTKKIPQSSVASIVQKRKKTGTPRTPPRAVRLTKLSNL